MRRTVVLDVVGLTGRLFGPRTPSLQALAREGAARPLDPVLPAVTSTVQATFMTGQLPRGHGVVGNGWYFRELAEIMFWRQPEQLMAGERIWDVARRLDPAFTVAKLFWWFNMYGTADLSVTPRPVYPADGRKIPDIYTSPPELREELTRRLGPFPLFRFWGPAADLTSTRWIARCARHVYDTRKPTLTLVYLPHLDYDLQRYGPDDERISRTLGELDEACGELIEHFRRDGARVLVISEYGIGPVTGPVHPNRALRRAGLLRVREELGQEKLDAGASEAFAVADHQIAHVYVRDPARIAEVQALLAAEAGIEQVLDADGKRRHGLDHPRSGELVLLAAPDRWFTYYHWLDDDRAPDYARTVDIHRKPGYDPAELFFDPALRAPKLKVAWTLLRRSIGFRTLLSVISAHADMVRGSHGRLPLSDADAPLAISSDAELLPERRVAATTVKDLVLAHVFGDLRVTSGSFSRASSPAAVPPPPA